MNSIIVLHDSDNVGICKVALPAGVLFVEKDVTLLNDIPAMHKVAIRPITRGEAILKYGQTIGFASRGSLLPTRLAKVSPGQLSTGSPAHSASATDVWPLQWRVSR